MKRSKTSESSWDRPALNNFQSGNRGFDESQPKHNQGAGLDQSILDEIGVESSDSDGDTLPAPSLYSRPQNSPCLAASLWDALHLLFGMKIVLQVLTLRFQVRNSIPVVANSIPAVASLLCHRPRAVPCVDPAVCRLFNIHGLTTIVPLVKLLPILRKSRL